MTDRWQFRFQCFLNSLMFFTRLPISKWVIYSEEYLNKASAYLPFVGIVVGCIAALSYYLLTFFLPIAIAILLSMVLTIYITGALHEDGFADCCDGFGGGWTKEQILTILKDSRLGTYGTIGLILILALKYLTLTHLPLALIPFAMISAHTLSRYSSILLMSLSTYTESDLMSKSKPLTQKLSQKALLITSISAFLSSFVFFSFLQTISLLLVSITIVFLSKSYFYKKIQGFTGDTLGSVQQVTEVACYLTMLALHF